METEVVYFLCYGCITSVWNKTSDYKLLLDSGRVIEQPYMPPDGIRWPQRNKNMKHSLYQTLEHIYSYGGKNSLSNQ